mmetsp:Transcript_165716/g.318168  ORF Transcript_165716/g.318168 Transcript_165716/m.318168 type:complete len:538 (-) Transcript_165716:14-1627(-)
MGCGSSKAAAPAPAAAPAQPESNAQKNRESNASNASNGTPSPASAVTPAAPEKGSSGSTMRSNDTRRQGAVEKLVRKMTYTTPKQADPKGTPKQAAPKQSKSIFFGKNKTYADELIDASAQLTPTGGMENGFPSIAEPECMCLDDSDIAPLSMPQEVLALEKAPLEVQYFSNGDKERKIYCNVELEEEEQKILSELLAKAAAQDLSFYPSVSANALRCASHARGDTDKAIDMMEFSQRWRMSFFKQPLQGADVKDSLKHGFVYWAARDFRLMPALVFRAKRIPQEWLKKKDYDPIIKAFVFCIEYFLKYMVLAGRVESFVLIIDLAGMGVSQIPVSALSKIMSTMGGHYCGRCASTFVCNMSWTLRSLVGVAKGLMTERQVQKLVFVKDAKVGTEFKERFALHQLEQDFGGTRPNLQEFFPFPMVAGPFDAGNSSGPRSSAVPRCHEAFDRVDSRGRIWNPEKSKEENTKRRYTEKAAGIYKSCGLPIPPELAAKAAKAAPEKDAKEQAAEPDFLPYEKSFPGEIWTDTDGKKFYTM